MEGHSEKSLVLSVPVFVAVAKGGRKSSDSEPPQVFIIKDLICRRYLGRELPTLAYSKSQRAPGYLIVSYNNN
jgi:hypothetical protein